MVQWSVDFQHDGCALPWENLAIFPFPLFDHLPEPQGYWMEPEFRIVKNHIRCMDMLMKQKFPIQVDAEKGCLAGKLKFSHLLVEKDQVQFQQFDL